MAAFQQALYEAALVAFGKVLSRYDAFAQGRILREVGTELLDYLQRQGYSFETRDDLGDLDAAIDLFVRNGFASRLDVTPAAPGQQYVWHDLYGIRAYKELHDAADNPFLSCPLNLVLYAIAGQHGKTMRLHEKSFDMAKGTAESQYELVDLVEEPGDLDPLVIENARLCRLAQERADRLEKAQRELKVLRGIIPICASCKRVRDDAGYWEQVEGYLARHSEAKFSHGLCPECAGRVLSELPSE